MFNIGWVEFVVLAVIGLFIFGPERLPSAAAWAGRAVRQVREYASGARAQLREELGPEFDEISKPLEDLRGLRRFDARRAVTNELFDGLDDGPASRTTKPNGYAAPGSGGGSTAPAPKPLNPGERPPFDPDAT